MIPFQLRSTKTIDLGLLPYFFDLSDPDSAKQQIHKRYAHGGGWNQFNGFELVAVNGNYALKYPEDPLMKELARGQLRDETISLFQFNWVAIIQKDGTFEVARID